MAVLGKIRALGPVALISVIGLALFAFVFSTGSGTVTDVFKADEFNQSRVAIVNGIEMDRSDFMQKVDNIEQQNRGSRSSIQAMNSVWTSELKKLVLQSEYEKIGIQVEREMMRDFLKTNLVAFEDFQNENGEFDESKLNQFIRSVELWRKYLFDLSYQVTSNLDLPNSLILSATSDGTSIIST